MSLQEHNLDVEVNVGVLEVILYACNLGCQHWTQYVGEPLTGPIWVGHLFYFQFIQIQSARKMDCVWVVTLDPRVNL